MPTITLTQLTASDGITMQIGGFELGQVLSLSFDDSETNTSPSWYSVSLPAATQSDVDATYIDYILPDDKISTAKAAGKSVVTCSSVDAQGVFSYAQKTDVVVIGIPSILSVGANSNSVLKQVTVNTMELDPAMMSQFANGGRVVLTLKR